MKYLLDTNICIYIIKHKPLKVIDKFRKLKTGDVAISSITLSELEYGVQKSKLPDRNKLALIEFLSEIEILSYDELSANAYGEIRADLEKKGKIIGALDMLIAAHAVSKKLVLVTNNEKEFSRIERLKIEKWI